MYRIANRRKARQRRRSRIWLVLVLFLLAIAGFAGWQFLKALHQKPVVVQSKPHVTKLSYVGKTRHYNLGDFSIDIPAEWQQLPAPPNTYNVFIWSTTEKANNLSIEVFEDNLPVNFAPNRALAITGEGSHIQLDGQASDNCITYTNSTVQPPPGQQGIPAKWQNIDFLCNRATTTRDVVATASADGINFVRLTKSDNSVHKFLFVFDSNQITADYTPFYNALTSFTMN